MSRTQMQRQNFEWYLFCLWNPFRDGGTVPRRCREWYETRSVSQLGYIKCDITMYQYYIVEKVLSYFEMKALKSKDLRGKNWYQTLRKFHLEISPLGTIRMKQDQVEEGLHYLRKPTMTKLLWMSEGGLQMPAGPTCHTGSLMGS